MHYLGLDEIVKLRNLSVGMVEEYSNNFENLNVWKVAHEIRIEVSSLIKNYPVHERYELSNQTLRAARSVGANIAEGHGRFNYQENIRFCRIARGSLNELIDHLIVANMEGYLDNEVLQNLKDKIYLNIKILNGYIFYLGKQKLNQRINDNQ